MKVPNGLKHLTRLSDAGEATRRASNEPLREWATENALVGTSLSALYQAATCYRSCSGGAHILEALAGRSYNLGAAAHTLILRGYYDEGLNLVRSIGEIANLIAMSAVDKEGMQEWLASDLKTRLKKFSPSKVRRILKQPGKEHPHFDDEWYSRLCEDYTHVTPSTKPNLHNDLGKAFVGGTFQKQGLEKSLGELATALGITALMICAFFKFADLSKELNALVDLASAETGGKLTKPCS
jgi:hypothetical protein